MDMLKKGDFTYRDITVTLSELSALQRIDYLDFLAKSEKVLPSLDDSLSESEITRLLLRLDIETGALLVGMSLWQENREGPKPDELAANIVESWPPEAIRAAELRVKDLSNMLPPEVVEPEEVAQEEAEQGDEDARTLREDPPMTAEKPTPVN
ncbi:TPA: phage minor tail protein domain-containing protein [Klebsiella oxytoca]